MNKMKKVSFLFAVLFGSVIMFGCNNAKTEDEATKDSTAVVETVDTTVQVATDTAEVVTETPAEKK